MIAAVFSHEHVLFAHEERSNCARGVRTQQSFPMEHVLCARTEIQVCLGRENAAAQRDPENSSLADAAVYVLRVACRHIHMSLRTETDMCVCTRCRIRRNRVCE